MRAAGVRISLAESLDAMKGVELLGTIERDTFAAAMKTTLIKEAKDQNTFSYYFPLFFGSGKPPLQNIPDNLSPQQQDTLKQALQSLMGNLDALRDLLKQLVQGKEFSREQLDQAGQNAGLPQMGDMNARSWMERRMRNELNMQQIQQLIEELMQALEQMGMEAEARQEIRQMLQENARGLAEQISQYTGASLAEQMADREPDPKPDLMDVPFTRLSDEQVDHIRDEIRRLAARLRSRASLRQRRANTGTLDTRRMMRANMRYGGVPLEVRYKQRHVKPSLVLICDVSTSMRYCAEFLLTLIYELQDQVARTHSFIFISDMVDISQDFNEHEPQEAVARVLEANPPGYYSTDLGSSLVTFKRDHMGKVTGKTTVIILGDGRNNHNNPRSDIAQEMQRKSRRLIWFNPEHPSQWGTGDSDMLAYAPLSDGVYRVSNLRELAVAVDNILTDG
jgi:uncharacterized protein with von Willebrand factor type A (vWA) domain